MSDKMREEFEVWALNRGYNINTDEHGDYISVACWSSFEAWKASRAALVVDLSKCEKWNCLYIASEVHEAITSAGVKYE